MWHRRVGGAFQVRLGCVCGAFEVRLEAGCLTRDYTGLENSRSPIENFARKVLPIAFNSFQCGIGALELRFRCVWVPFVVCLSCVWGQTV